MENLVSIHSTAARTRLPAKMPPKDEMNLWSMLIKNAGKELSKISMPVEMNEPLSFLQRVAENMEYVEIIHRADTADNPLKRFEYVIAFIISLASSNYKRMCKPFNPLLGETFELDRRDRNLGGYHVVCEQVKHHPPVSAFHVDGGDVFRYWGALSPKTSFSGKNLQITIKGSMNLELLRHRELYTWHSVPCFLHNLLVGEPTMENVGVQNVLSHGGQFHCQLKWKGSGTFGGREPHGVKGYIYANGGTVPVRVVKGRWCDKIYSCHPRIQDNKKQINNEDEGLLNGAFQRLNSLNLLNIGGNSTNSKLPHTRLDVNKKCPSVSALSSGQSPSIMDSDSANDNDRLLWEMNPRPSGSEFYYNFTYFALSLNEYPTDDERRIKYPPTDSRFRGDIRFLEEGNLPAAANEKLRLEANQRLREQVSKKTSKVEEPKWFIQKPHPMTGEPTWLFTTTYYDREWSDCVPIFQ